MLVFLNSLSLVTRPRSDPPGPERSAAASASAGAMPALGLEGGKGGGLPGAITRALTSSQGSLAREGLRREGGSPRPVSTWGHPVLGTREHSKAQGQRRPDLRRDLLLKGRAEGSGSAGGAPCTGHLNRETPQPLGTRGEFPPLRVWVAEPHVGSVSTRTAPRTCRRRAPARSFRL